MKRSKQTNMQYLCLYIFSVCRLCIFKMYITFLSKIKLIATCKDHFFGILQNESNFQYSKMREFGARNDEGSVALPIDPLKHIDIYIYIYNIYNEYQHIIIYILRKYT